MAKITNVLTNIGDVVGPVRSPTSRIRQVGMWVGAGSVGTFLLEAAGQDTSGPGTEEWIAMPLNTADQTAPIAGATGLVGGASALYAWADIPGTSAVRLRKSAGVAGASRLTMGVQFSGGQAD